MITLRPSTDTSVMSELGRQYLASLIAPLDGMWDTGLIGPAPHFELWYDEKLAGYYVANDEGALLQFYVLPDFEDHTKALFDHVVAQDSVTHAEVATIDPRFLSLCLDVHESVKVHTYLYEENGHGSRLEVVEQEPDLRLVDPTELETTVAFQEGCLGGGEDRRAWLRGYSRDLIEKQDLFVLTAGNEWLGLGECRRSLTQPGVCDLGMMVAPAHRGQGWGTHILDRLRVLSTSRGHRAICSTTVDNVASQKAIVRAGFRSRHRLMNVRF